jgi:MtN3 and saliva related transmembrane protein
MSMQLEQVAALAGSLGGMLSVGAFLPQAWRILQRRSAKDISLTMYIALILASLAWMFYAYVYGATALFMTNLVIALIALAIAVLKLRYGRR